MSWAGPSRRKSKLSSSRKVYFLRDAPIRQNWQVANPRAEGRNPVSAANASKPAPVTGLAITPLGESGPTLGYTPGSWAPQPANARMMGDLGLPGPRDSTGRGSRSRKYPRSCGSGNPSCRLPPLAILLCPGEWPDPYSSPSGRTASTNQASGLQIGVGRPRLEPDLLLRPSRAPLGPTKWDRTPPSRPRRARRGAGPWGRSYRPGGAGGPSWICMYTSSMYRSPRLVALGWVPHRRNPRDS